MTTVSEDCRFKPRPAARMDSRKMKHSELGALNFWIAASLHCTKVAGYESTRNSVHGPLLLTEPPCRLFQTDA